MVPAITPPPLDQLLSGERGHSGGRRLPVHPFGLAPLRDEPQRELAVQRAVWQVGGPSQGTEPVWLRPRTRQGEEGISNIKRRKTGWCQAVRYVVSD